MNKYLPYLLLFTGFTCQLAMADHSKQAAGCALLIQGGESVWSSGIDLAPRTDASQPHQTLDIKFHITDLTFSNDNGVLTTYYIKGDYEYEINGTLVTGDLGSGHNNATCSEYNTDKRINLLTFPVDKGVNFLYANDANNNYPSSLNIPDQAVTWNYNSTNYTNPESATLQK